MLMYIWCVESLQICNKPLVIMQQEELPSHQLYPCSMEAIRVLTAIGFHVRSMTSDGATSNRKFFDIIHDGDHIHKSINPFEKSKHIYAFSDVPHLLKTTCNCFENSHWNKKTRTLHLDK
eukprot:TCONS_00049641-protein